MYIVLFITFTYACMTKILLIYEIHDIFLARHIESRDLSRVGRITHVGYVRGSPNGKICKSTNGTVGTILPMVTSKP